MVWRDVQEWMVYISSRLSPLNSVSLKQAFDKHCLTVSSRSHSLRQVPIVQLLEYVIKTLGNGEQEIQQFIGTVSGMRVGQIASKRLSREVDMQSNYCIIIRLSITNTRKKIWFSPQHVLSQKLYNLPSWNRSNIVATLLKNF